MTNEDNSKKLRQQITSLRSSNRSAILETLKELRSEGDISVLPELFSLMLIQEDEEILDGLAKFLNDLKDKEAAEVLAKAVANPEYEKIQTTLVAACWQNGLSYGKYIPTFVDVIISGDYSAAIEAFTVIEEAVGDLEQEERASLVGSLKSNLQQVEEQKKALFVELVRVIESY
jgi:thioredoxin-like negative regulator of GroEL